MAMQDRGQETGSVPLPRPFHAAVPKGENNHWNKNPFLKDVLHEAIAGNFINGDESGSYHDGSVAEEDVGFVVRCQSGYKSALKSKDWILVPVPQPNADENRSADVPADLTEESKNHLETICPDQPPESLVEYGLEQPSMEAELLQLTASIDFKDRLTRSLCREFALMAALPQPFPLAYRPRCVTLPARKPKQSGKTLLLDLEGTLIYTVASLPLSTRSSYEKKAWTRIQYKSQATEQIETVYSRLRPGALTLLAEMAPLYECVVFSEAEPDFAFEVVQKLLDPEDIYIDYILSQDNCVRLEGWYQKDLRVIANRKLSDLVLLDDSLLSFSAQLENGIRVKPYRGKDADRELQKLTSLLSELAPVLDVRDKLRRVFLLPDLYRVYLQEMAAFRAKSNSL